MTYSQLLAGPSGFNQPPPQLEDVIDLGIGAGHRDYIRICLPRESSAGLQHYGEREKGVVSEPAQALRRLKVEDPFVADFMAGVAGALVADQSDNYLVCFSFHGFSSRTAGLSGEDAMDYYTGKPGKSLRGAIISCIKL
jgi:hypothetical protein